MGLFWCWIAGTVVMLLGWATLWSSDPPERFHPAAPIAIFAFSAAWPLWLPLVPLLLLLERTIDARARKPMER